MSKRKKRNAGGVCPIDDLRQLTLPFIVPAWESQDDDPADDPRERNLWHHLQQSMSGGYDDSGEDA